MKKTLIAIISVIAFAGIQANAEPRVFEGIDPSKAPPVSDPIEADILSKNNLSEVKEYIERTNKIDHGKVELWEDKPGKAPTQIKTQEEWEKFLDGNAKLRITTSSK